MSENEEKVTPAEGAENQSECGCEGNCCPPKKNKTVKRAIFALVLLAALAVITVKILTPHVATTAKEPGCKPGSGCCDTTRAGTAGATKDTSCCSKTK